MVSDSFNWNISNGKCNEIIHLTLIDILSERNDKTLPLNKLVELLNSRTKIYKLSKEKKYNSFSKYLKNEHNGILNFIENYNFYDIIKTERHIYIRLYKHLVDLNDIRYERRITKDSDWMIVPEII